MILSVLTLRLVNKNVIYTTFFSNFLRKNKSIVFQGLHVFVLGLARRLDSSTVHSFVESKSVIANRPKVQ